MEAWQLLRHNQPVEALEVMRATFNADRASPSVAIELGAIYMWLQEWESAWKHFCDFRTACKQSMDIVYVLAGTARWCARDHTSAIQEWNDGRTAAYTDGAGGVRIPLHLYFAAVCHPDSIDESDAIDLLKNRLNSLRGHQWPSHLARLVLNEVSYDEALAAGLQASEHLEGDRLRQFQEFETLRVRFWNGVKKRASGNEIGFLEEMDQCGAFTWNDFENNEELTIDRLRSSEFHLARSLSTREGALE